MTMTKHAERRAQQRGIGDEAIDAVVAYGRMEKQAEGRRLFYLDRKSVARAKTWSNTLEGSRKKKAEEIMIETCNTQVLTAILFNRCLSVLLHLSKNTFHFQTV